MDQAITFELIEEFLIRKLSASLLVPSDTLDVNQPLTNYGLDSMSAVVVVGELEEWLDVELPSTLLWDYPTINDLAAFLSNSVAENAK